LRKAGEFYTDKWLRGIWSEGTFATSKREHGISRAKIRGTYHVHEECLLFALALYLKRIVKMLDKQRAMPNLTSLISAFLGKILTFGKHKLILA